MVLTHDFALPSAFGLTFLLFVGLSFFIRASTKDRTETAYYRSDLEDVPLLEALQRHFADRAYRVTQVEADQGQISLEGMVRASLFLAIFLGGLAAIGLFCLALVLAIAFPQGGYFPYLLLLASPVASWFYWRGSTRAETVTFQLLNSEDTDLSQPSERPNCQLRVSAHRDELIALESRVPLKRIETE